MLKTSECTRFLITFYVSLLLVACNIKAKPEPIKETRGSSEVAPITVTSPSTSLYYSKISSLTIGGACSNGYTVYLGGDSTNSTTCNNGAYNFSVSKTGDGRFAFSIYQIDSSGSRSDSVTLTWIYDTTAPAAPVISAPLSDPFTSGDTNLSITGSCESGGTVYMIGAQSANVFCVGNKFTFVANQNIDGNYLYSFYQVDAAGNSSVATPFHWIRDTDMPSSPEITSPDGPLFESNQSSLTISGTCLEDHIVELSGDILSTQVTVPANNLTQVCSGGVFSFTVVKYSDTDYNFGLLQTSPVNDIDSAKVYLTWRRDTVVPAPPTIVSPAASPYNSSGSLSLSGSCETGGSVSLAGASAQETSCTDGSFSFFYNPTVDGTFDFSLTQKDKAQNVSSAVTFQWVRASTVPPAPVITTPASSPSQSSQNSFVLSGSCVTGYTVTLSGVLSSEVTSPAGQLTQTCAASSFSYTLAKSVDGAYDFSVTQESLSLMTSPAATMQWIRDTTPPVVTFSAKPSDPNLNITAAFQFSANEAGATFECSTNGLAYASCTSPVTLSNLLNTTHTFQVRATDTLGNTGAPTAHSWTQNSGNTVALYHFDNSPGTDADSSLYGQSGLTHTSTSAGSVAKFGQSINYNGSSSYSAANHVSQHDALVSTMTVDGFIRLASLPSNGQSYVIASKMGTSGQMGWEIGVMRSSNKTYLYFAGSQNGTSSTIIKSSQITLNSLTYYHFAATWNKGTVKFFLNGSAKGTGTIGVAGSTNLFKSTADLTLGRKSGSASSFFSGIMDEIRISQTLRWSSKFTVPTTAFTAD